jgi:hypothetical protein
MEMMDKDTRAIQPEFFPDAVDLNDPKAVREIAERATKRSMLRDMGFGEDVRLLRVAETYSFNDETIGAITQATESIPHDTPLSAIETPTGAGWFWFANPLPIMASPIVSNQVNALLWGWTDDKEPAIVFSAYVLDAHGKAWPSTRWYWPLRMTFHDMIAFNAIRHEESYGPGGLFYGDPHLLGKETTLKCVADLSLFFLAACVWFKQKILISAPGHVERHARKRYVREHKLKETPSVQVIALRASLREPSEPREAADGNGAKQREYSCHWIVKGHHRLQACGPGRANRKLIFILPHPAGPMDKPLRTKERVYAVIR